METSAERRWLSAWRKALGVALLALALAVLVAKFDVRALLREALVWIEQLGAWGQVLFVVTFVVATGLPIPGSVLGLGAGALFGVVRGSLLASLASTFGATCAFLLGRFLARDWVVKRIQAHPSLTDLDEVVAAEGRKIVFLMRLSPLIPFPLLNYALALTRVSLRDYVLASWIGMLPGTVMDVYLGSLARVEVADRQRTPAEWMLYGVGLLATIALAVIATRIARRALAKRTTSVS